MAILVSIAFYGPLSHFFEFALKCDRILLHTLERRNVSSFSVLSFIVLYAGLLYRTLCATLFMTFEQKLQGASFVPGIFMAA